MRRIAAALSIVGLILLAFFAGAAWGAEAPMPKEVGTGAVRETTPELAAPVPAYLYGDAAGVLAWEMQRVAWWKNAEAGAVARSGADSLYASSGSNQRPPQPSGSNGDFLACVRAHESDTAGGYQASNGTHFGAYQFAPSTWNSAASRSGRDDLVGVDPRNASPADQDAMASYLYQTDGAGHWAGSGCY